MNNYLMKIKKFAAQYSFRSKIWKYSGPAGWYFLTLPKKLSDKIRKKHGFSEEGWGRLKTLASVGKTNWNTSIWYGTKPGSYLLPIKLAVRKKEKILVGSMVAVTLKFNDNDRSLC